MDDELECFRRAADLGCKDFLVEHGVILFRSMEVVESWFCLPSRVFQDLQAHRINHYAAAVCAEWWNTSGQNCAHPLTVDSYIKEARAFGKKYGAPAK